MNTSASAASARRKLPASATHGGICAVGLACFFATFFYCRAAEPFEAWQAAAIVTAAYALPVLLLEVVFLRTPWRPSVGLDFSRSDANLPRIFIKLVGLYGSFGFVALLYWLFPEYHGSFYGPYWDALSLVMPYVLALAVPYVAFMDSRMKEPEDAYYRFGRLLMGNRWEGTGVELAQHLLGWVVKGFFLPLMWVSFVGNIRHLTSVNFDYVLNDFAGIYRIGVDLLFTVDLLGAVAGYALAIRLFDTHIRSSEPTLFGWLICLMCYQPFLSIYMRYYLAYSTNDWFPLMADYPWLQVAWGSLALAFLSVYSFSSIYFGCRFSNLTHRGVLTGGFYRFTKHPAYVTKNLFWWMVHVPFIPVVGWLESLRYSLLMLGISAVYYLRARTEERHLSHDPVYVEYALAMNERSLFRRLAHWLPFLKYRPPVNWQALPVPYRGVK